MVTATFSITFSLTCPSAEVRQGKVGQPRTAYIQGPSYLEHCSWELLKRSLSSRPGNRDTVLFTSGPRATAPARRQSWDMPGDCEAGSLLLPRWGGVKPRQAALAGSHHWPVHNLVHHLLYFLEGLPECTPGRNRGSEQRKSKIAESRVKRSKV